MTALTTVFKTHKLTKPAPHKSWSQWLHVNCHDLIWVEPVGVDLLSRCCNRRGHNHNHSKQQFVKLVKVTTRNFQVFVDSGGFFWQKWSGKIFASASVEPHNVDKSLTCCGWSGLVFHVQKRKHNTKHATCIPTEFVKLVNDYDYIYLCSIITTNIKDLKTSLKFGTSCWIQKIWC